MSFTPEQQAAIDAEVQRLAGEQQGGAQFTPWKNAKGFALSNSLRAFGGSQFNNPLAATPQANPAAQPDKPSTDGTQGFGQVFKNPEINSAAVGLAGGMNDADSIALMEMGNHRSLASSGGGVMSPFEAAANGLKQGIGTYNLLKTQKTKQSALAAMLRQMGGTDKPEEISDPEAGA